MVKTSCGCIARIVFKQGLHSTNQELCYFTLQVLSFWDLEWNLFINMPSACSTLWILHSGSLCLQGLKSKTECLVPPYNSGTRKTTQGVRTLARVLHGSVWVPWYLRGAIYTIQPCTGTCLGEGGPRFSKELPLVSSSKGDLNCNFKRSCFSKAQPTALRARFCCPAPP